MGARYYAPCIGRFTSRDPSGFGSGPNVYAYCLCDPIDFFDLNGCDPWETIANFVRGLGLTPEDRLRNGFAKAASLYGAYQRGDWGSLVHDALGPLAMGWDLAQAVDDWGYAEGQNESHKISADDLFDARFNAAVHIGSTALALGAPFFGGEGAAAAEVGGDLTLYRAASQTELADIEATGGFRLGPNSISNGKWFAEDPSHAAAWGEWFSSQEGGAPYSVVQSSLPESIAREMIRNPRFVGIGPARFAAKEHFPHFGPIRKH
jgi:hypothetical protein